MLFKMFICLNLYFQNESEIIPFPNKQEEFSLPDRIYGDLMDRTFPRIGSSKTDSEKHDKADKPEKERPEREEKPDTSNFLSFIFVARTFLEHLLNWVTVKKCCYCFVYCEILNILTGTIHF